MAEDLAREIIAQSGSGSKLASFSAVTRFSTHPEMQQVKRYFIMYTNTVTMMTNDIMNSYGIDCEEVVFLGKQSSSMLTKYLQDKVKLLNAVNVKAM
eukprot:scaffold10223_cov96-Skeletonema_dohrnii-CCMP3373.AAC.4